MITGFIRFLSRGAAARVSAIALVGAIGLGTRNAAAQQPTPAVAAPVLSPSEAERKLKRDARDAGLLAPRRALEALPLVRPSDEEELPSRLDSAISTASAFCRFSCVTNQLRQR